MEPVFAVFVSLLSILIIASAAVDITLENQDNHSPFFHEGAGHDASLDGHKVFTKDELSKYNGDNVGFSAA